MDLHVLYYGTQVRLQHVLTGARLQSQWSTYERGSEQQQVTGHYMDDDNDWFLVKQAHNAIKQITGPVPDGAFIRLEHVLTGRNLHSHDVPAHLTKGQKEVSCFGRCGNGDWNCNWLLRYDHDNAGFRLMHVEMSKGPSKFYLHSHAKRYPAWVGHEQQEVTLSDEHDPNNLWRVRNIKDTITLKVLFNNVNYRVRIAPKISYEAFLETVFRAVERQLANFQATYFDEEGDICVLNSATYPDFLAVSQGRDTAWKVTLMAPPDASAESDSTSTSSLMAGLREPSESAESGSTSAFSFVMQEA